MKTLFSRWRGRRGARREVPIAGVHLTRQDLAERYSEEGSIARGGMSTVLRVRDRSLLRTTALKRLDSDLAVQHEHILRFLLEAQITGQLDHPNIVPIHELGRDRDGTLYFTMKIVEGQTLADRIEDYGERRLEPDRLAELLQVLIKVCEALSFAHSRGVIHRDVKPSNIMVGLYGQVYIMDWGVARLLPATQATGSERRVVVSATAELDPPGCIIGSPAYMAPEQVEGLHEKIGAQTDVFALGATLYHILTGQPPYSGSNAYQLLTRVLECDYPPPEEAVGEGVLPPGLIRIANKAMAADPADRYPTASAMQRDVELFMRGAWHLPSRTFAAGSTILAEGDDADAAYIITEGRCLVSKEIDGAKHQVRVLESGEVFGEMAIFSSKTRTATVEAIDDVTVMVVTRELLSSGLELNSWMGRFVKAMADRFVEIDERLRIVESGSHKRVRSETE